MHFLVLRRARDVDPVSGALRRVLDDGGVAAAGGSVRRRGLCADGGGADLLALCLGGAAVPLPAWLRRAADADGAVDRDGLRLLHRGRQRRGVRIEAATIGRVQDLGIKDANNMGAAMAPAAIDTLQAHFRDLRRVPQDYDLIVTGDLGALGKKIVLDQFQRVGVDLTPVYDDCGVLIYDPKRQDVHAGGSGCGCGASVLCGYLLDRLEKRELRRLLFCATGALLSPTSSWQGESIPGICHAVAITAEGR